MFISLLKSLGMMLICGIGTFANAANQSTQEPVDRVWSMLIDTSAPEFSTQVGKLRERMTRCRAGRAVLYRNTGMTRVIVEPLRHGYCKWRLFIETEGHKVSFSCAPKVGARPPRAFFFPHPSSAELARLQCEPIGIRSEPEAIRK